MEKLTLTRKEAAEQCNVSLPTLDAYLQRRENPMPCIRAGRKVIIPLEPLKEWLEKESTQQTGACNGRIV